MCSISFRYSTYVTGERKKEEESSRFDYTQFVVGHLINKWPFKVCPSLTSPSHIALTGCTYIVHLAIELYKERCIRKL